ncbi:MAG: serine/threonine protein kinase [Acidobacteria bacterium]|nr:serine/threonine protein kinase [Acidobacteriota bacterium]
MIALKGDTTMLYCPKCRRTYEEGTQRFCDNDGGRLLPVPAAHKPDAPAGGVFTNLLGKIPQKDADHKTHPAPRFIPLNQTEETEKKLTSFPSAGRIFQSEQFLRPQPKIEPEPAESVLELEPLPPPEEEDLLELETPAAPVAPEEPKPLPRIVKPSEIPSGTASVGDRRTNPAGRTALSWDNTGALIGQTVKGRYLVTEELPQDDDGSLIYLAEDRIIAGRKVVVRVFMNEGPALAGGLEEKIFAEERVSLSHLNHPNIAAFFDSGELPEGNEFIVTEFVDGRSLAEMLGETGQFNSLRTARIIRQTSYALSEAHQNGILHRNLKPENIILTVSEAGIEQVKLMNFGVSHGEISDDNLAYKAPEELESGITTFASDIYALGVIAYQMLTGGLPFEANTESELLRAQKQGWKISPAAARTDVQPLTDKILEKALAVKPAERYPKARDFGDAFFNALTTVAPWTKEEEAPKKAAPAEPAEPAAKADELAEQKVFVTVPSIGKYEPEPVDAVVPADIHITPREEAEIAEEPADEIKWSEDLPWEKRSPELPKTGSAWTGWLVILGVVVLLLAFWGVSKYLLNRQTPADPNQNAANVSENTPVLPADKTPVNSLTSGEPDIAPEPRLQKLPPDMQRFQNNRENLKDDLAKNFLGFEVFYPLDWKKSPTDKNFLDIAKKTATGVPVEQLIVTRYESRGTMTLDRPNFPKLAEKSKRDLGDGFKVVSEGEANIQNGRWKAYEVKYTSSFKNDKGEEIPVWVRRLWVPVQRAGTQNGFVITLLATSLAENVKSVDEVGVNGDLAKVLETFEPEQF